LDWYQGTSTGDLHACTSPLTKPNFGNTADRSRIDHESPPTPKIS
jgi:hypothetical protein